MLFQFVPEIIIKHFDMLDQILTSIIVYIVETLSVIISDVVVIKLVISIDMFSVVSIDVIVSFNASSILFPRSSMVVFCLF